MYNYTVTMTPSNKIIITREIIFSLSSGKETRISTWEIIGISLGSVFLILASLAAAYLLCRKRKHIRWVV